MKTSEVKIGMKVAPYRKTAGLPVKCCIRQNFFNLLKRRGFLYVGYELNDGAYGLTTNKKAHRIGGGYVYNASDFEPYVEPEQATRHD
jgi:hypothetical protein